MFLAEREIRVRVELHVGLRQPTPRVGRNDSAAAEQREKEQRPHASGVPHATNYENQNHNKAKPNTRYT